MDPPQQTMDEARSDEPVESSTTLDYLCSRIPAEIRNAIYQQLVDDKLEDPNAIYELILNDKFEVRGDSYEKLLLGNQVPTHAVFRRGRATSRPWLVAIDPTLVNCLHLCSINKQIRAEFGSLLTTVAPLIIRTNEISASFATFFRPDCLSGVCGHSNHTVVPRQVKILIARKYIYWQGPLDVTDILRAKAWDSDLKIQFFSQRSDYMCDVIASRPPSTYGICALLNWFLSNPPAVFLDAVKSGLIKSVKFKPGKGSVIDNEMENSFHFQEKEGSDMDSVSVWELDLQKSSGKLTSEDKDLLCSYCSHAMQYLRHQSGVQVEFLVRDDKGRLRRRWHYCSSSKALLYSPIGRTVENSEY